MECWFTPIIVPEIQLQGSAPTTLCTGDVTPGLAPQTTTAPNTSKFAQKMREHAEWAQKKAEAFQGKEAQCHKKNYDK